MVMTAIQDPPAAAPGARGVDLYFTSAGARLRYRDEGRGPAVVLVHGWTLDLSMWDPQVGALRDDFRVIRLDRRGFGLSSGQPSLDADVADLAALCRHLALGRIAVIGMSQGARAALAFAVAAPSRVACLALDGPPGIDGSTAADDDVPFARYRALIRAEGIDAVRREWASHPLARLRTGDAGAHALLRSVIARYPGTDLLTDRASADAIHGPIALEVISVPALVITGECDLASRVHAADVLARRLLRSERAQIPDAGHLPNLDNPDAYNRVIRAFLSRHTNAHP